MSRRAKPPNAESVPVARPLMSPLTAQRLNALEGAERTLVLRHLAEYVASSQRLGAELEFERAAQEALLYKDDVITAQAHKLIAPPPPRVSHPFTRYEQDVSPAADQER
jgi:hypothetical protein